MPEYAFIILLVLVGSVLWSLIGKYPELPANVLNQLNTERFDVLHVFSAETADGKEAEFIDEKRYDKQKIIRFCRAVLVMLELLVIIYLLGKH